MSGQKLHWEQRFTILVNGVEYIVGLATDEVFNGLNKDDSEIEAVTDPFQATIVLCEGIPDKRRPAVFWHEYIHAAFGEVGVTFYSQQVMCKKGVGGESQEKLATFLGPILSASLGGPHGVYEALRGPIGRKQKPKKARRGR